MRKIRVAAFMILFLVPVLVYPNDPYLEKPKIFIIGDELLIILKLKNSLDFDRLSIIEKGIPVKLTYNFSLYEKNLFFFDDLIPYNLNGSFLNELKIIFILSYDYISKKYTIKIKKNYSREVETKYIYSGKTLKESYSKLKLNFFEKKISLYINLNNFKIQNNYEYYISAKAEFTAVKTFHFPIRIPNPFNFKTSSQDSQAVKYVED